MMIRGPRLLQYIISPFICLPCEFHGIQFNKVGHYGSLLKAFKTKKQLDKYFQRQETYDFQYLIESYSTEALQKLKLNLLLSQD